MIYKILAKYWGFSSFRSKQEEIIKSVLDGRDTLAILPTGGGKSICFQVPAMASDGIAIVVTPLISLMKDLVENLSKRGIKSLAVYSGMPYSEIDVALDNAVYGDYKFLYVSPERLRTDIFIARLKKMKVNFLIIDEAHCISQWGYDFRPDYLLIKEIRKELSGVPVVALTATATPKVAEDIMEKLGFVEPNIIKSNFERDNLSYIVRRQEDKLGHLLKVCSGVKGSGIVYMRERLKCEEIASFLRSNGVDADFYHAGLSAEERSVKQMKWKKGDLRVIVATNAFGMGIDKPDVRYVCHFALPDSIESYFQEAGRAGRDGLPAFAVLLWNGSDISRLKQIFNVSFPSLEYIADIYQKVFMFLEVAYEDGANRTFKFDLPEFVRHYKLQKASAYYAIKYLEISGYWTLTEEIDNPSRITFIVSRDELYKVQLDNDDLDYFIKSLMRIYPLLFSTYVSIDEDYIARVMIDSKVNVVNNLKILSRMHVINYIPRVKSPLLFVNNERLTESNLFISKELYEKRKAITKERMEAMISYVQDEVAGEKICRSRRLVSYFGQTESYDCGKCDICRK